MANTIQTEIASGKALLFLENFCGSVSINVFEGFIRSLKVNVYLVFGLLLSEKLISISENEQGAKIVSLTELPVELHLQGC